MLKQFKVQLPVAPSKQFLEVNVKTLKTVIPLGLMFFCILFNYTILEDTKDVLVVTAEGSSAEIIPFLKTLVNLPMAIGFMIIYTELSNVLSKEALFYTCIFPFIGFFGAFGLFLYPLKDVLHPTCSDVRSELFGTDCYSSYMEVLCVLCHGRAMGKCVCCGAVLGFCQFCCLSLLSRASSTMHLLEIPKAEQE